MKNFDLVVADVVHFPVQAPSELSRGPNRLLRLANSWLRRRGSQHGDSLLLIGVGFSDEHQFRSTMVPYGLDGAELRVVDVDRADDPREIGEVVESALTPWLQKSHARAIPVASFPEDIEAGAYPPDVWWSGIESATSFSVSWDESIEALLGSRFVGQATTWAAVLEHVEGPNEQREDAESFRFSLTCATFARWLCAFDAAAGNNFFNFEYDEVTDAFDLNLFRLGYEAASLALGDLEDEMENGEDDTHRWAGMTVRALLQRGDYLDTGAIREFFGGSADLLFALYTSIWPRRQLPAAEACAALTNIDDDDGAEINAAWRFVDSDDWSPIDDDE